MPDRTKVIKGLETCIKYIDRECPIGCPYYELCTKYEGRVVFQPLLRDTLKLIKQKPIAPFTKLKESDFRSELVEVDCCGNCGHELDRYPKKWNFCPECGQAVKWKRLSSAGKTRINDAVILVKKQGSANMPHV